jgi:tetratricopeptide (TPR) repeat protein
MSRSATAGALVLLAVALAAGPARAQNDGQADLDKATEAKWDAKTLSDLDEVVRLCETALEKGLDKGNTQFANTLLAATLAERGFKRAQLIFGAAPLKPKATDFRKAALDDLEKAVKLDPKLPGALLLIAKLNCLRGGDLQRAKEALDQLINMDTEETPLQVQGLLLRSDLQQDPQQKLADLDEAIRLAPGDAKALRARAVLQADQGKLEPALADLDKAIELDPKHAPTYQLKAQALAMLHKYDEALLNVDKACELDPHSSAPLVQKASIHAAQNNLDAALLDLDEAIRRDPDDAKALRARAVLHASQGRLEAALADLDKAIELQPNDAPTYEAKAQTLTALHKYDEALVSIDKARELDPHSVDPLLQKARIHAAQDNFDAALADLELARSIDPGNLQLLLLRAGLYEQLDQRDKALAEVDEVLKLKPDFPPAIRLRAMLLAAGDKLDEAIAELERIHKLLPDDVPIALQLGMSYNAAKQSQKALDVFTAVLEKDPDNWLALRGHGDALLNCGKHAQAIDDYQQALKLRDGKRAIDLATQACKLTDYKAAHILSTLAAAYAEVGDFQTAIKWAQKGLEVAEPKEKEPMGKELETYRAGKPFRELLRDGEPVETDQAKPQD